MRRAAEYRHRLASALVACALVAAAVAPGAWASDRVDGRTPAQLKVSKEALPDVSMKAGALITEDGRVLWSRRADDRRAMASLTKMMAAVVALENSRPDEVVKIPTYVAKVGESTSELRPGTKIKMSELLEALLIKSGNDAAIAVAANVAGSEEQFVKLMNAKAEELGLDDTHFENAHGLDEKGHRSSARDLGVLARYAMTKPEFRRIVRKPKATVTYRGGKIKVHNTNLLLGSYKGANGVKTGWTSDAGYCVAASADRGGTELYAIVLGTSGEKARFADARELLDWGYAHYRPQHLVSAGTVLGVAPVTDYLDTGVRGEVSKETTVPVLDLAGTIKRSVTMAPVAAPVKKGQRIGVATFTQGGRVVATVPLVATEAVEAPGLFERAWIAIVRLWRRA